MEVRQNDLVRLATTSSPGYLSPGSPSLIVVAARQSWSCAHGTFSPVATVSPAAQISHRSSGRPTSRPFAVGGSGRYLTLVALPPTTSQRYQRAPSSHALSDGRNQAQLAIVRSTRLSSVAPRNFS